MINYHSYAMASVFLGALVIIGASFENLQSEIPDVSTTAAASVASTATTAIQGDVKAVSVTKTDYIPSLQSPAILPDPKNPDVLIFTFATGIGKFHLSTNKFEFNEQHYVDPDMNVPQLSKSNNKHPLSPEQRAYFETLMKNDLYLDRNAPRAVGSLIYAPVHFASTCDTKLFDSNKKVAIGSMLERGIRFGISSSTLKSALCHVAPDPDNNRVIFYGDAFGQAGGDVPAGVVVYYNKTEKMMLYSFEDIFSKFPAHESRIIGVTRGHLILSSRTGLYNYDSRSKTTKKIENFKVSMDPAPIVLDGKIVGFTQRRCMVGCGSASTTLDIKVLDIENGAILASSTLNGAWWHNVGGSLDKIFVGVAKKSPLGERAKYASPLEGLDIFRFDIASSSFVNVKLEDVRNEISVTGGYQRPMMAHVGEWTLLSKVGKDEPFKLYVSHNGGATTTLEIRGVENKPINGHVYSGLRDEQTLHDPYWFDADNKNVLWLAFGDKIARVNLTTMAYRIYSVPYLDTGMSWAHVVTPGNQFDVLAAGDTLITEDFFDGVRVYKVVR